MSIHLLNTSPAKAADGNDAASIPPRDDWRTMAKSEHFVQFYEDDDFLVESVSQFIGAALGSGGGAVVIATSVH